MWIERYPSCLLHVGHVAGSSIVSPTRFFGFYNFRITEPVG